MLVVIQRNKLSNGNLRLKEEMQLMGWGLYHWVVVNISPLINLKGVSRPMELARYTVAPPLFYHDSAHREVLYTRMLETLQG